MKKASPLVIKRMDWPEIDRDLWRTGTTWDPAAFRKPYAAHLSATMLRNAERGWGRFLAVLAEHGRLDPTVAPAARVGRDTAQLFLDVLRPINTANSIKTRFWDLRAALKVMQPAFDTTWITKPSAFSLHQLLPTIRRRRELVGTKALYDWALGMMAASATMPKPLERSRALRNGLIIAIFASRAPRIRSMAAVEHDQHLQLSASTCWLLFGAADMKTSKPIEYELPPRVVPWVRRYLQVERRELLAGADHDAMWVGSDGTPLKLRGIEGMVRRAWETKWGKICGTHQFRHELASALAEADPDTPGMGAAMLGISIPVADETYTHVRGDIGARKVAADIDDQRASTRLLAQRLFGD
jgi:integrase